MSCVGQCKAKRESEDGTGTYFCLGREGHQGEHSGGGSGAWQFPSRAPEEQDRLDAARWRWWCRWWLDERDDMEKINGLDYEGDSQASLNAAIDAEIEQESRGGGETP